MGLQKEVAQKLAAARSDFKALGGFGSPVKDKIQSAKSGGKKDGNSPKSAADSTAQLEEPPYEEPLGTARLQRAVARAQPYVQEIGFELAEASAVLSRRLHAPPGV